MHSVARSAELSSSVVRDSVRYANRHQECVFWTAFGVLAVVMAISRVVVLPVMAAMVLYSAPTLYIGSHLSLHQREVDPATGKKTQETETLGHWEAYLLPVTGSAALFGLYLAYKFLSTYWVNLLLSLYFTAFGCVALASTLELVVDKAVPKKLNVSVFEASFHFQAKMLGSFGPQKIAPSVSTVISYLIGIGLGCVWIHSKDWTIQNCFAVAFAIQTLRLVSLGSFKVAVIVLAGLFLYDIFWVFGTNVMITVAKSFEGPAKIVFPTSLNPLQFSLLGLGDIIVPGIFIAMILRFDYHLAEKESEEFSIHKKFNKVFFWCNFVAYECGLVLTIILMKLSNHPQPALLYLVPFCLAAFMGPLALLGRLNDAYAYSEEEEEDKSGVDGEAAESASFDGRKADGSVRRRSSRGSSSRASSLASERSGASRRSQSGGRKRRTAHAGTHRDD